MNLKKAWIILAVLLTSATVAMAGGPVCDPTTPTRCVTVSATGSIPINAFVSGATGGNLNMDAMLTDSARTVGAVEAMTHDGKHFSYTDIVLVTSATNNFYCLVATNTATMAHVRTEASATGSLLLAVHDIGTLTATGSSRIPVNNDRNSANTAKLVVYKDCYYTTIETRLEQHVGHGVVLKTGEWIIKPNTMYVVQAYNPDVGGYKTVNIKWYEE